MAEAPAVGRSPADPIPNRMHMTHLASSAGISAQYNPLQLELGIAAVWERIVLLGQSFQPMVYIGTENLKIGFDLEFDERSIRDLEFTPTIEALLGDIKGNRPAAAMRFLYAIHYPPKGAQDIGSGNPSSILLTWPALLSLRVKPVSCKFTGKRFFKSGKVIYFSARVEFECDSAKRLTFEDVMRQGFMRGAP